MRALRLLSVLPFGLAVACGGDERPVASISDELRADLRLVAAGSVELAGSGVGDGATSAIERLPSSSPEPTAAPRRTPRRTPVPAPSPEPSPEPAPAPAPAALEEGEMIAEAPAPSDLPAARRPVPAAIPTGGGDIGARGGGSAGDAGGMGGGVIWGVVIRGGGTGDDCEIHDRRRRRRGGSPPIAIGFPVGGDRVPGRTFPTSPGLPRY